MRPITAIEWPPSLNAIRRRKNAVNLENRANMSRIWSKERRDGGLLAVRQARAR